MKNISPGRSRNDPDLALVPGPAEEREQVCRTLEWPTVKLMAEFEETAYTAKTENPLTVLGLMLLKRWDETNTILRDIHAYGIGYK
jgi:hypothetical protein